MKTLADVIAAIRAADLPERKQQEMVSASNTAARALCKLPERIPADPSRLMAQLHNVVPQSREISERRWANSLSLIRAGLALAFAVAPRRTRQYLSEQWKPLYGQLDRWGKLKLSRCLRFFSAEGIDPNTVTQASFAAFRDHLDVQGLSDPDKIFAAAIDGWRQAQAAVQGWPTVDISRPSRRRGWTLTWSKLPPSLRQEFDAWSDRSTNPVEDAPLRPVKARTIAARDWQIRAFATALVFSGRDPPTSLRDLVVDIDAVKAGLRYLVDRYGGPTPTVYGLAVMLKGLARHHLNTEQAHLDKMTGIIRRLQVNRNGMTEKNAARLGQFHDLRKQNAVIGLPHTLMEWAARHPDTHKGAIAAQTAVALEILLMAPIRIENLSALDLERHFVHLDNYRAMRLILTAEEVKNREPGDYPVPPESAELIQHYLTKIWPRLASPGCTALFPGRKGGAKSINAVREQICTTIHRHTGVKMNPHLFRHFAAKIYLDAHPGDYETVRRLLGHRSITTTIRFYAGFETAAAVRRYDELMRNLRKKAKHDE